MAYKNKTIKNSKTGQEIKFLQTAKDTNGELLEMESTFNPFSKEPPAHYHPFQVEDFTILSGELLVKIDGELRTLKKGDSIHITENKIHSMWNNSCEATVVNWKVQPALNTEQFFEITTGLANAGKTNENGIPNIFQVALIANYFSKEFRFAKPNFIIQKILFLSLLPFGYLSGYRPLYKNYLD